MNEPAKNTEDDINDWLDQVHYGSCCSDDEDDDDEQTVNSQDDKDAVPQEYE